MADELLRVTKLASTTRLSDRYLTVQVKEAPDADQAASFGTLCALVEIEGSWQSNAQIGQTIINTASRQYYRGTHANPIANFEDALKKVNETLKHATQTGATDWIGHLHAALVVAVGSDIHIAATGQVYAALFRDGVATPMHEPGPEHAQSPTKAFGALLSGTVEQSDQLVIASSGFQQLISAQELQELLSAHDELPARLGSLLRTKRGGWVNAFLIDAPAVRTADTAATIAVDRSGGVSWKTASADLIARTQRFIKPLSGWFIQKTSDLRTTATNTVVPAGSEHFAQATTWSNARIEHLKTTTLPVLRERSTSLWNTIRTSATRLTAPTAKTVASQPETTPDAPPAPPSPSSAEPKSLIGRPVYAIRDYSATATSDDASSIPQISDYQHEAITKDRPALLRWKLRVPNLRVLAARIEWRSLAFGLIALILLVVLAANITVISTKRQTEQSKQELLTQLNDLQDTLEEARLARIFNQPEKAAEALATVLAGLPPLLDSSVRDGALLLQDKAQAELDDLTSTTRLKEFTKLADLPQATSFAQSGSLIAALTETRGIERIDDASGKTSPMAVPGGDRVSSLTAYDTQAGLIILTDKPAAFSLTPNDNALAPLTSSGEWKSGQRIATFFGNLYLLAPGDNQVWKYLFAQASYGKPEAFITDGTSLADAVDLAVDGQLYVLFSNGSVKRFNRGKADSFAIGSPPKPTATLNNPAQLVTTKDSNRLYILDGNRIVSFDKSGAFQAQYAFDGLDTIRAFAVDEGKKVFTILTGDGLYTGQF